MGHRARFPHLFATLARTFADPDERAARRRALSLSWMWFAAGPIAVLLPYAVGALVPLPRFALSLGGLAFDVFFRLWAYYHVVRQHWGFLALYRRKAGEAADAGELTADTWFFNAVMYLPVLMLLTAPWYGETRFPPLGFQAPLVHGWSLAQSSGDPSWRRTGWPPSDTSPTRSFGWAKGSPRNGSKLLFLASVVPLHLLAFASPLTVLFLLPIVTVGHNLQYHRIVWGYGTTKYRAADPERFRVARTILSCVWLYAALGLLFTLVCYHGPWVEWVSDRTADALDTILAGLASLAGVKNPSALNLGDRVVGWFVMGWAMQHYTRRPDLEGRQRQGSRARPQRGHLGRQASLSARLCSVVKGAPLPGVFSCSQPDLSLDV